MNKIFNILVDVHTLGCLDRCDPILMTLTTISMTTFSTGSDVS